MLVITTVFAVSGAAGVGASSPLRESAAVLRSRVTAPEHCPRTIAAVRFYGRRLAYWAERRSGAGTAGYLASVTTHRPGACPRYLAHLLQRKARAARRTFERWHRHEFEWWLWLPDKFARVGACETGYGKRPGSWTWNSGTYVSAFGIYRPAYEQFHRWTGHNTPREQYEVAAAIQARYGWSAWGCGGA